jgi:hypothetical protein
MNKVTVRFARFWSPGSFVGESWDVPIGGTPPDRVEWPARAYAFSVHERTDVVDGGETFVGKASQVGPTYYHPDSVVKTLEEVRISEGERSILFANMECNGWSSVVYSRWGNWPQPFDPAKAVILTKDRPND